MQVGGVFEYRGFKLCLRHKCSCHSFASQSRDHLNIINIHQRTHTVQTSGRRMTAVIYALPLYKVIDGEMATRKVPQQIKP